MVNWYKTEQKFFGMDTEPSENVEETVFESGKSRYTLKNSSAKLIHSFSFLISSKEEELSFWNWYNTILLSRTQTVGLIDLVSHSGVKEYRMIKEPQIQNSQYPKECSVSVKEE